MTDIQDLIPHRPPFLFLDAIVEADETTLTARRKIRAEEPQFEGHYPGKAIMPGVLLCEAVLQAGCALMALRAGDLGGATPVVTRMSEVKFKRVVEPGDDLEITVRHERTLKTAHFMAGTVKREGKVCASLEFCVMLTENA